MTLIHDQKCNVVYSGDEPEKRAAAPALIEQNNTDAAPNGTTQ